MNEATKILVRGVNWLGDAVMTTPALQRLREAQPEAHIALLTPAKLAELWLHHPAINEIIVRESGQSVWSVARRLRAGRFQIGLALPNSPRAALELWLAGVPRRVGYARPWRNWWLTQPVEPAPGFVAMRRRSRREIKRLIRSPARSAAPEPERANAHQLWHYLHLVSALGASTAPLAPQVFVADTEVEAIRLRLGLDHNSARPLLGLNPGAQYGPAKRWPAERFSAAAIEIQQRTDCQWLILGGVGDVPLCAGITGQIQRAMPQRLGGAPNPIDLAGATSLRELCAALKLCRVLLTNDTGPMHLAAAVGTPVVVPFGSTSAALTGPGLPGDPRFRCLTSDAACRPCFRRVCPIDLRCLTAISVQQVVAGVLELVNVAG